MKRLKAFIDSKELSIRKFETVCGISNATLSRAIKNDKDIGTDKLVLISEKFSDLNLRWLLTGKGPMILEENVLERLEWHNDLLFERDYTIKGMKQRIEELELQLNKHKSE